MTEGLLGTVESKIKLTENKARFLFEGFETLLTETGYSVSEIKKLIQQFGVACLDVEYGTEIPAFSPLNPRVLFAAEPENVNPSREALIGSALTKMLEKYPRAKVVREEKSDALIKIQQRLGGKKLELVTWLNIFDDDWVGKENLTDLIQKSGNLLTKGGLFVCSFIENEDSRQRLLETMASTNFPGLRMKYHESPNSNVAGNLFLIAEKLS